MMMLEADFVNGKHYLKCALSTVQLNAIQFKESVSFYSKQFKATFSYGDINCYINVKHYQAHTSDTEVNY